MDTSMPMPTSKGSIYISYKIHKQQLNAAKQN